MDQLFPTTNSKPEKIQLFALIPAWLWIFVLLPMFMPFVGLGLWEQTELSVWLEIGYHIANGIAMLLLLLRYLKDEWFMVQTDLRYTLKHIALTVGLAVAAELVLFGAAYLLGGELGTLLNCLPAVEMFISHTPLLLLHLQPILGTVTLSVFAPISICALFYCFGFAPVCYRKPWLAYPCIAALTLIPTVINILWRGQTDLALSSYLVQLPVHLLMCWSYQKTDNVWTPLLSLAAFNLLASVVLPLIPF